MSFRLEMNSGINYLEVCAELAHYRHILGYRNYISPKMIYGKNQFPEIKFRYPSGDGTMLIRVDGRKDEIMRGEYYDLLTIYSLIYDLKDGSLNCRFCKRKYPEGCSVVVFLNLIIKGDKKQIIQNK